MQPPTPQSPTQGCSQLPWGAQAPQEGSEVPEMEHFTKERALGSPAGSALSGQGATDGRTDGQPASPPLLSVCPARSSGPLTPSLSG